MKYFEKILKYILSFEESGYIEYNKGAKLYGRALHIAQQAYNHKLYRVLNNSEIELLERQTKTSIPLEYKKFLKKCSNGLGLFVGQFSLDGLRIQLGRTLEAGAQPFDLETPNTIEKPENAKEEYFFIGGYSYDASKLYIDKATGKVHYCKKNDATSLYEWNCFEEMLVNETERLFKLFDNKGVRLVEGIKTLPK